MILSNDTLSVLKNFSTINPNVVLKPGQKIKTISDAKNILAVATVEEDFPRDMGIYDLSEFLSVFSIVQDGQLEFTEKKRQRFLTENPVFNTTLPNRQF